MWEAELLFFFFYPLESPQMRWWVAYLFFSCWEVLRRSSRCRAFCCGPSNNRPPQDAPPSTIALARYQAVKPRLLGALLD